ncbi:MAG: sulfurtransferase complex subunit TusB [Gammaproteobacteria bacterium]|jgi:sulfur relay protein TusB/DsrH|nr:sulfurtransferase complex subunit TusB [Gammaproteobacteria bacterium]MBT4147492.1 sulfurtransferase complex subunit TusB [Gammaproteobacteria bacterium]MBT5221642.1 sulfurtransferase complex subunit TusB [Gammaproteobacteria bacterium]MBT5825037.1 sulfurtransferase complex subunit TusB [Gammaproteobacteria bacterium]MBT5965810.1 sulfurtransferase complex subunit TusB [Gammaproteobacteria bacterium]
MLHIISTSAGHEVLFARIKKGDAILFTGSAVLCLRKNSEAAKTIETCGQQFQCFALQTDLLARGLNADNISTDISIVDYPGFVTLTLAHEVIKSWK